MKDLLVLLVFAFVMSQGVFFFCAQEEFNHNFMIYVVQSNLPDKN